MQKGSQDVAEGPLSEGHLTDGFVQDRLKVHKGAVQGKHLLVVFLGYQIDVPQQFKGLDQRQVPPQLAPLSEDNADPLGVAGSVLIGHIAAYGDLAACGLEDACHHLDRGGLSRAVRAEVSDDLALFDGQGYVIDRLHDLIIP